MDEHIADRLRRCFEEQRFEMLTELYSPDARLELHVGAGHEQRKGVAEIVERYTEDYQPAPTFLRWDVRPAPWGAVIEAEASQGDGAARVRFRWAQLLTVDDGRITDDVVYCTGAVPEQ